MRRFKFAAVAVLLLTAGCAGDDASGDSLSMEEYFVELSNIHGEAANSEQRCVDEAGGVGFQEIFTGCVIEPFDSATGRVVALVAPEDFVADHEAYLAVRRAWSEVATRLAPQLEFEGPTVILENPEFVRENDALLGSCRALESAARGAGFSVSLSCEEREVEGSAAPNEEVTATIDSQGWAINPAGMIDSGAGVVLTITNRDDKPHQPVVADLLAGDPSHLPVRDGIVDFSKAGVVPDANADPEVAHFALVWPEPAGEGSQEPLPDLAPGDLITVDVLSGNFVIFDQLPGAYEAGEFTTLVIVSLPYLEATYVEPPLAAQSCDELVDVVVGLYDAYLDEVAMMTADGFLQSPLSMIDDLRFGAVLQPVQQLECEGEAMEAAVQTQFCQTAAPPGSAPSVIIENVCRSGG